MKSSDQYMASISARSDFCPGTFVEANPAAARAVTPARMRRFAGDLAEPWQLLADILQHLGARGWAFAGATVEPGSLIGEIRRVATSAELHDDIASLPPAVLDLVSRTGVVLTPEPSADQYEASSTVRWTRTGWVRIEPDQ